MSGGYVSLVDGRWRPFKKPKPVTINDNDRDDFVQNHEGWYNQQQRSGLTEMQFVRKNRDAITQAMKA